MYVFGGYEETLTRFGLDVYRLDLRSMEWKLLACKGEPPIYRDFHSATAINGCMYVFGGRSDLTGGWPGQLLQAEFYSNKLCYLVSRVLVLLVRENLDITIPKNISLYRSYRDIYYFY